MAGSPDCVTGSNEIMRAGQESLVSRLVNNPHGHLGHSTAGRDAVKTLAACIRQGFLPGPSSQSVRDEEAPSRGSGSFFFLYSPVLRRRRAYAYTIHHGEEPQSLAMSQPEHEADAFQ